MVLVGSFMVIALAAGIFFYANSGSDRVAKKEPKKTASDKKVETPKNSDSGDLFPSAKKPDTAPSSITDQNVANQLKGKGDVGDFRFVKAQSQNTLKSGGKKVFVFSKGSAFATYMDKKNSKNAIALFAGLYVSHEMVKKDFKQSKRNAVRSGAKISKDSSKGKVYTATMQKDGKWLYLTCRETTCYLVVASDALSLLRFIAKFS